MYFGTATDFPQEQNVPGGVNLPTVDPIVNTACNKNLNINSPHHKKNVRDINYTYSKIQGITIFF
jgi:hypothetical protein